MPGVIFPYMLGNEKFFPISRAFVTELIKECKNISKVK